MAKFISPDEAVKLINDNDTVVCGGFGSYLSPDALFTALGKRYKETGHPSNLTTVSGISTGDFDKDSERGMNAIAIKGLLGCIIAGHVGNPPKLGALAAKNEVAAFTVPLGVVVHLFRSMAGRQKGLLTKVGLNTFADPRIEGCMANEKAIASGKHVVELVNVAGEELLYYPTFPVNVALIRASYADENGSLSIEREGLTGAEKEIAAAVHNNGGIVIAQVEKIVPAGSIHPRKVRIHSSLVDYVVVCDDPSLHMQNYANYEYDPSLTGEAKAVVDELPPMKMSVRKLVARRAAMELKQGCIINLGIGMPSGVGSVANEEGIASTLSVESGPIGGVPVEGTGFAGSVNPEMINTLCDTFDLYDGGYLDYTFLGAAEIDENGNVNVSKFGPRCTGPGGLINISQNTPNVFFIGSFTAGKSEITIEDGKLKIVNDADGIKFVKKVQQITFSADYARKTGQKVRYITERAVFELGEKGLILTEIAPGVDLEKDILGKMDYTPEISKDLRLMDERIFKPEKMGLSK